MCLFYGYFEDYPARAGVNADLPALKFRRAGDFSKEYLESFLDEQIGYFEIQSVLLIGLGKF